MQEIQFLEFMGGSNSVPQASPKYLFTRVLLGVYYLYLLSSIYQAAYYPSIYLSIHTI